MSGARLEKTGDVFTGIRRGFFRAENNADAGESFVPVDGITRTGPLSSSKPAQTPRWPL